MKILLLNQCFWPDVASTAQHLSDLAVGLAERGHEVTVVCADRGYDNQQDRFPSRERWRDVEIVRVRSLQANKKSRWQRAVNFGSFLFACAVQLLFLPRQDVVIALTSPPLISWLASWLTQIRGGRLIFWVMDLNPDEAIAAGWLVPNSAIAKMLERFLSTSMDRSETIIVLDRFVKQRIVAKGVPPEKIHIIPPWSLNEVVGFDLQGREEFRRAHGLADKFVVMYAGNHSPCHPLRTLLEAAEELAPRKDIVFCFVGGGSEFGEVRQFASSRGLPGIICWPYQPRNQLAAALSSADLHVVVMGEPFVGIIHPCKIYNVLNVQAPFLYIGPRPSHITEIVESMTDISHVYSAEHGEVNRVVEQIRSAAAIPIGGRSATLVSRDVSSDNFARMLDLIQGEHQLPLRKSPAQGYSVKTPSTVTASPELISRSQTEKGRA